MGSMDIIYNVSCGAPSWEMEVVGTDGIARAHLDVTECVIWHKNDPGSPKVFYRCQNDVIGEAVNRFIEAVLGRAPLDVTLEHGRNVLELSLAWKQSALAGLPTRLPLE